ncbi:hypothetical protein N7481_003999 [Penicillium waksmanii]|uniref:uncharacterized protein n=1 Tax=Penicillium waksmanii TaxID=69791 RepID=UPI002547BB88|nr:uncharacterized protein N7481_003999 [Penicillium waksmanii]KAJ5988789.1 hypothetical protein N7481_003999 [Penicillium waksmanii]
MASCLETLDIPHLPKSLSVYVALYRDVQNAAFLRQQLLSGNKEFEYAFIDASMVFSRAHATAAIFRAINDYKNDRLKSHNVHSEIVFSLNPANNIADSFRKFGVADSTKDLLAVKVSVSPEITRDSVAAHLEASVQGTPVTFDDQTLSEISDVTRIKKMFKLGALPSPGDKTSGTQDTNAKRQLEMSLVGAIALRGS